MAQPKVIFLLSDYGHDPTETAVPWKVFREADFDIEFSTENGNAPKCDEKMISGWTGTLLGANKPAKDAYKTLSSTETFQKPKSWTADSFNLYDYDLVFLPGGHDKGVRQLLDSEKVHQLLASYFPKTRKPSNKSLAAICHGVQVLAHSRHDNGKCILHDVQTTALIHGMEQGIYHSTRLFLGDYYKTYGAGTASVQNIVKKELNSPSQFKSSMGPGPFVVEDPNYNYLSGRFPGDAEMLAKKAVELVKKVTNTPSSS